MDDEVSVRIALGRLLRLASYDVAAFESGEAFTESLAARLPDCALVDVHMPGISGFEVQARLRAAKLEVPIVFITANDDAGLAERAGATRLLRKPFSNDALLEAIAAALRR